MIDLSRQHTDVGFAYRLASFLVFLEDASPLTFLRAAYPDDFTLTVDTLHHAIDANAPDYMLCKFPTGTLILIAGANNIDLGIATLGSYTRTYTGANPANANPTFYDLAATIKDDCIRNGFDLSGNVRIIGHSMGGAIAAHLQYILERGGVTGSQCITLNAPRLGTVDFCTQVEGLALTRYFCNDCPVQFVPCHTDEATIAHAALSFQVANSYNRQTHPRRGIAIAPDGTLTDRAMPAGPLPNTSLSILQWLLFSTIGPGVNHKLQTITYRLGLAADRMEPPATVRARADANERPPTIRPRAGITTPVDVPMPIAEVRRIITATRPAALAQVEAERAASGPARELPDRFRPVRFGSVWAIQYAGTVVEVSQGKRDAKARSRRYNRLTRQGEEFATVPAAVTDIIESAFDDV